MQVCKWALWMSEAAGGETSEIWLLRRGTEWDLTPSGASETNSHKSHTTQGWTTPRATCSQLSEGSHRTRCATHMITHLPSPSPLAPAETPGTHTQTQRQKVGQPLTFSRQLLIQCDLRNLFSEKGVPPPKKRWSSSRCPDWNVLLPIKC